MTEFVQALFVLSIVAIVAIVYGRKFGTKIQNKNTNSELEVSISKEDKKDS